MRKLTVATIGASMLVSGGATALWRASNQTKALNASDSRSAQPMGATATTIEFKDLLDSGPKLRPSALALAMNGKRVRIVGFMANMELPMEGSFYLVPHPITLDEAGGGTADLPLQSVLVVVPSMEGKVIAPVSDALEGVGILEVGNRSDAQGRVSNFRLKLDFEEGVASRHTP